MSKWLTFWLTFTIASTAEHEIWINGNSGNTNKTSYYDEELVNRLQEIPLNTATNKFIVIHLMGSHVDYQERYPKKREKFSVKDKSQRRVNSYDNSVVYTDYVLQQIYSRVCQQPAFKGLVYMSDHGEDMKASHEVTKFTWTMAHIPFFIHLSPSYCQANPEIYNTLLAHKNFCWTNDLLYDVLLSLMGIQNVPSRDETLDLSSAKYRMQVKDLYTCHRKKKLTEDPDIDKVTVKR